MKAPALTLDEHRRIGSILTTIRNERVSVEQLNRFRKNSHTHRRLLRVARDIDRLRSKLDTLACQQYPDADTRTIYYGVSGIQQHGDLNTVLEVINGRVPVRILDIWLRCHHSVELLNITFEDCQFDMTRVERQKMSNEINQRSIPEM